MLIRSHKRLIKRNKYGNHKCEADGIIFDSKAERQYYWLLKLQKAKFKYHEKMVLRPKFTLGKRTISREIYTPDFTIYDDQDNLIKVVDVKGGNATLTPLSRCKMRNLENKLRMPVILARYNYRTKTFEESEF